MKMNAGPSQESVKMGAVLTLLGVTGASVMKDFSQVPQALNALTTDRGSALQKYCRQCVRWRPVAVIWSQSQNAAAMGAAAGVTSVSCAHFLELPSTKRYVLMAQDTLLMDEILTNVKLCQTSAPMVSASIPWAHSGASARLAIPRTSAEPRVLILMNVPSPRNRAISSARTPRGVTSARVHGDTSCKRTGRHAKTLMNATPNNTTASSSVSTLWEVLPVNVHLVSHSITLLALTTMNVGLSLPFVEQRGYVKTPLEVSAVNAKEGFLLMPLDSTVKMLMNVMETIGANMAARTSWEVTDVVVLKDIFNITSGISVLTRMNAPIRMPVALLPATTPWGVTSAPAPRASPSTSSPVPATT